MNIDEKIKTTIKYREDLQQQIKSIEGQSALLQQRHQALFLECTRAEGAISALQEFKTQIEVETATTVKE